MSTWPRRWASVAATLVVAAPGALLWSAVPVAASMTASMSLPPCAGDTGVTVVVDFHQLGGGAQTGCDPAGGGRVASAVFPAAGFPLTDVQQTPGFTCRVSGKPVSDPCVRTPPATAYWSLWWSDGRSGTWSYSTLGVGSLKVPEGGYVAFSWQGQAGQALPGVSPTPRRTAEPAASSTPSPDKSPDKPPKSDPSPPDRTEDPAEPAAAATPTATAEPDQASPTASAEPAEDGSPAPADARPSADPSPDVVASEPPASSGDEPGRLPGWFSVALILGVGGAAATAWWWRRPESGGG